MGSKSGIRSWIGVQLAALGIELLIGMAVNLWVQIPARHPGTDDAHYLSGLWVGIVWVLRHGGILVATHILLALALWLSSIGIFAAAARSGSWRLGLWTLIGWVGITGAGFNGGSFVNYGLNLSSFLMTVGLVVAVAGYLIAWGGGGR